MLLRLHMAAATAAAAAADPVSVLFCLPTHEIKAFKGDEEVCTVG